MCCCSCSRPCHQVYSLTPLPKVTYPHHKREEILQLLEEHITENIVKIGHTYYKQTVGIPQGSVLSALLCSFFYGDLEKRRMPDLREDGGSVSACSSGVVLLARPRLLVHFPES